jgi:nucleotide-binding universal stress UspA family protein
MSMSAPSSILVPIDGSPASLAALDHAIALADPRTRIDVLVVDATEERRAITAMPDAEIDVQIDDAVERAQDLLPAQVFRIDLTGDPLQKILETASSGSYQLIVMGTHGHIGRLHALLGSVAEGVVRNAPCPVLTVRDTTGGYQSFAERRHGRSAVGEHISHRP